MNRRRILSLALGFVAPLSLLAVLLMGGSLGARHAQYASDGAAVRLLKITSGTEHRCTDGNLLQRAVARLMSDSLAQKLRVNVHTIRTTNFTHTFWFDVTGSGTNSASADSGFTYQATIRDENGALLMGLPGNRWRASSRELVGLTTDAHPTASRTLVVELHRGHDPMDLSAGTNASTLLTVFRLSNPWYVPTFKWQAQPLPIHVQNDGLDFTLKSFLRVPPEPKRPADDVISMLSIPVMRIDSLLCRPPGSTNNWSLRTLTALNELGHFIVFQRQSIDANPDGRKDLFTGHCHTNSLIKLRFEFVDLSGPPDEQRAFDYVVDSPSRRSHQRFLEVIVRPEDAPSAP